MVTKEPLGEVRDRLALQTSVEQDRQELAGAERSSASQAQALAGPLVRRHLLDGKPIWGSARPAA